MQARLASVQLQGSSPDFQMQLNRMLAQIQALQLENTELQQLASRLMDENAALQAVSQLF